MLTFGLWEYLGYYAHETFKLWYLLSIWSCLFWSKRTLIQTNKIWGELHNLGTIYMEMLVQAGTQGQE